MKTILTVLPFVLGASAFAQEAPFLYEPLATARARITLPEMSLEEKTQMVDQSKFILRDLFVHRDHKIKHYGPEADPLPALDEIRTKLPNLSTIDFHRQMLRTFRRLHDWHTTYQLPAPFQCYRSLLPVGFKSVKNEFGKNVIAVNSVVSTPEVLKLMPADVKFDVGDILVSYGGKTPEEAINGLSWLSFGANPAAIRRDAVEFLSFIAHRGNLLPSENEVEMTLLDKEGKTKSFKVPWISRWTKECVEPEQEETARRDSNKGEKYWQREYNQIFKQTKKTRFKGPGDLLDSREPIVKYKMIRNEFGSFSYLTLSSFVPEKLSVAETLVEIKRLLDGPLAEGEGLIIDLRDNGGGQILLGEGMVQLLNPRNSVPLNFVLKNSAANRFYWETMAPTEDFAQELRNAVSQGRSYTNGIPMNSVASLNGLGQSFMKPVAVFINASCYSTCDMFTASMQDLGAGVIFGEDPNTGAGGANNWSYNGILYGDLPEENKGPFAPLPAGLNIGLSYRQTFRTGLHAGELIEDVGVKADIMAEATLADLGKSEAQIRFLTRKLAEQTGNFKSWVKIKEGSNLDIQLGKRPKLNLKWENTSRLDIRANGQILGSMEIESSNTEGRDIVIPDYLSTSELGVTPVEILGIENGKRVWRKVISIRTIPESRVISPAQPLSQDFEQNLSPLVVYNKETTVENGWQVQDGVLTVGDSGVYGADVNSQAILFANLAGASKLSFSASVVSELDYDFFTVSVVSNGSEKTLLNLSGDNETKDYSFDLSEFKGKEVEIRFGFTSDGNINGAGPKIDNLQIK